MAIDWQTGQGFLKADGKMLEWGTFGPAPSDDRPVVVMLHEGLGCLKLWRDFPDKVAAATDLPVFAFSRAGYGQSDPGQLPRPLDELTRQATNVLPDVLNEIGAKHCILLGHSDGATIAAEYAGRVADYRVRGIVLMAPHFFTEPMNVEEIARVKEQFETTDLKARMGKYHCDPEATFRGWNDFWLDPDFLKWNVAEVIDYWRIPCLVIQGRDDQYGTIAQIEEIENRAYSPVEILLLDDCRHSPHFDRPEKTLAAIADFATRLLRIEAATVE